MGYKDSDRILAKIEDDEPIFILRAQDKLSIYIIQNWLETARKTLTQDHYNEARTILDEFAQWQQLNPGRVKFPD